MEENLTQKKLNSILLDIVNKHPTEITIINDIDMSRKLMGFSCTQLYVDNDYVSTVYGIPRINDDIQKFDIILFDWVIALLNYLKCNNLLDDFKQFYE